MKSGRRPASAWLTVWALALMMAILLTGCGGSDLRDEQPDETALPVSCAPSSACTR